MKKVLTTSCLLLLIFLMGACGTSNEGLNHQQSIEVSGSMRSSREKLDQRPEVQVEMFNTSGEKIGKAVLTEEKNGVNIHMTAKNLPKGTHGFHIHEKGMCEQPTFESAGGHFNPLNTKHGFDNPDGPHAGDLPNLEVGPDGNVDVSFVTEMVTLIKDAPNSLLQPGGTSLVIHEDADDYITQPSGNAGSRISCGVISD